MAVLASVDNTEHSSGTSGRHGSLPCGVAEPRPGGPRPVSTGWGSLWNLPAGEWRPRGGPAARQDHAATKGQELPGNCGEGQPEASALAEEPTVLSGPGTGAPPVGTRSASGWRCQQCRPQPTGPDSVPLTARFQRHSVPEQLVVKSTL